MAITLTPEELDATLAGSHTAIVTTLRKDGMPVSTPIWFAYVDGAVCFRTPAFTKKVRRIAADVYGDRPNAPAVALVEQAFSAKFDAQYGKGTCAASPDPRSSGIDCTWGPDKNAPLAKTHSFVLKDYGTAHLSVSVAAAK